LDGGLWRYLRKKFRWLPNCGTVTEMIFFHDLYKVLDQSLKDPEKLWCWIGSSRIKKLVCSIGADNLFIFATVCFSTFFPHICMPIQIPILSNNFRSIFCFVNTKQKNLNWEKNMFFLSHSHDPFVSLVPMFSKINFFVCYAN
jgi:hypothetical protein